jgi:hypothetical protein
MRSILGAAWRAPHGSHNGKRAVFQEVPATPNNTMMDSLGGIAPRHDTTNSTGHRQQRWRKKRRRRKTVRSRTFHSILVTVAVNDADGRSTTAWDTKQHHTIGLQ